MEKPRQIQITSDYSRFVPDANNRPLTYSRAIVQSMKDYGFLDAFPILVREYSDGKLIIIDGHHRFQFAKELQIPVKYVLTNIKNIKPAQLQGKPWTFSDFVISKSRTSKSCKELHDLSIRCGLGHEVMASLLIGKWSGAKKAVISDSFKITSSSHANDVIDVINASAKVVKWFKNRMFIQAVSYALTIGKADKQILIDRINAHPGLMHLQPNLSGFIKLIEDVHNHQTRIRSKVPIAFNIRQGLETGNAKS